MKTKEQLIAAATALPASNEAIRSTALIAVGRDELIAALDGATNPRACDLRFGATNAGANSVLYVQREHLLEALADEPAVV